MLLREEDAAEEQVKRKRRDCVVMLTGN